MPSGPIKIEGQVDVEVDLSLGDVFQAACALFLRRARYGVVFYGVLLVIVLGLLANSGGSPVSPAGKALAVGLGALPVLLLAAIYASSKVQFSRAATPQKMRYHFCPGWLDVSSDKRSGFLPLETIHEAIETKSAYLLFLSPGEHYLIPKRCFRGPQEVDQLRDLLREEVGAKAELRG